MRNDELLIRAGERERDIIKILNDSDKQDKRHIIRLYGQFEWKKHLCLVFELLNQDLRETLKQFGKRQGLSMDAVKLYAKQLFLALEHMRNNKYIHSDSIC